MFSPARLTMTSNPSSFDGAIESLFGCHSISPGLGADRTSRVMSAPSLSRTGIKAEPTNPLAPAIAIFILSLGPLAELTHRVLESYPPKATNAQRISLYLSQKTVEFPRKNLTELPPCGAKR